MPAFDLRITLQILFILAVTSFLIICVGSAFNLTSSANLMVALIGTGALAGVLGFIILMIEA